jgi:post-segregation antitoxin (ccd killing protein)
MMSEEKDKQVSEGQIAWSELLEDIKDVKGWPYPEPFHETMELFRQITLCYDNNLLDASVVLGRAIIDGAIFDAIINPPLPISGIYTCSHCGKKISGGLNGLQAHENTEHKDAKQWWEERGKFLDDTLKKRLEGYSKHKEYENYTDSWNDYDKEKMIGLENVATLSGLLEYEELKDISENIRFKAAVRLHRVARAKAYEKWRRENAEEMRLLSEKKIGVEEIEWFSWERADKVEAKRVLDKTGYYLGIIIKRYEGIWK